LPSAAFDAKLSVAATVVGVVAAVLAAVVFGLFPVRGLARAASPLTLQAYGLRQTASKRVTRFRSALASAQVALSMALLALTGVFAQSLGNIARIDLGLDADTVVTLTMSPEASGYAPEATATLLDRLEEELAAIPSVVSATSAMIALLTGNVLQTGAAAEGSYDRFGVHINIVSGDFFRTLNVGVLAGREFGTADRDGAPGVVVVNRRLAERIRPDGNVVGQRLNTMGGAKEIVGVVADLKDENVTSDVEPQVFLPRRQSTTLGAATLYIRSARPPEQLLAEVRDVATRVAPTVPITDLRTMRQQVRENLATERFVAGASTAFAVLATALAGLGLYGVLAYSVAQRSREIALRFALGAPAARVRKMVLRQVGWMALTGVAPGTGAALLLGRVARSLLFGVEPADPVALLGAAIVLGAVILCAAYLPARRASRVDPMVALRYE
jgi:predicted permease